MRLVLLCCLALVAAGCALRPRYADLLGKTAEGAPQRFVLTDAASGAPLAGAKVEVGEGRSRVSRTTEADGSFTLVGDKRLLADNPVLVVTLPAGVEGYTLSPATERPAAPPAPTPADSPAPAAQATTDAAADAGT